MPEDDSQAAVWGPANSKEIMNEAIPFGRTLLRLPARSR
jgi:hypothetical protein